MKDRAIPNPYQPAIDRMTFGVQWVSERALKRAEAKVRKQQRQRH